MTRRMLVCVAAALATALVADEGAKYVEGPSVLVLGRDNRAMTLLVDGNAKMTVEKGDVQVNSGDRAALFLGNGTLHALDGVIGVGGSMTFLGESSIEPPPTQRGGVADPFAFLSVPAIDEVQSQQSAWLHELPEYTLKPGVYYGGLTIGDCQVTLEPGLYAFVDGDLWVQRGARLLGDGVCLLFVGQKPGKLNTAGGNTIELTAPEDGPLAGVVLGATTDGTAAIVWGPETTLDGLVYAPRGRVEVVTGAKATMAGLVCDTLKVSLNVEFTVTGETRVPLPDEAPAAGG